MNHSTMPQLRKLNRPPVRAKKAVKLTNPIHRSPGDAKTARICCQTGMVAAAIDAAADDVVVSPTYVPDLVQACLDRIAAMDREGVALHAVIETNPDALEIAERRDAERKAGHVRSRLHGEHRCLLRRVTLTYRLHPQRIIVR